MNKFLLICCLVVISSADLSAQDKFTIDDIILRAQSQSPAFKQAQTRRENRYWTYKYFRSNYNPQIRMNSAGNLYNNSFTPVRQPDGSIEYISLNQFNPGVNFSLQQPLYWTGGTISVNSGYNYFSDINANESMWSGTPVNIQLFQPLFAFNQLKWDKEIQPIRFEESKRDYAETMEAIAREAVGYFFMVMQSQVNLAIAKFNLANNDTIYKIETGRYNIGATSEDKLLQVELQLLRSRRDVAQANLDLQNSSLMLRTYIGLRNNEAFDLVLPAEIPSFIVIEDDALDYARQNRSAFIAFERRKLEADQEVARAKGNRYQVGITAAYGANNSSVYFNELYQDTQKQRVANVTFDIPIVDWGRRRAQMKSAYANKQLTDYVIAQDQVTFEQEILTQVRQFEMLRLSIEITKKADEVAQERYNVAQNRYLIGKIDITNLNIALTEKDDAKRGYIQALNSFWTAYYDLRRLTLFDFLTQQPLYHQVD
jgi:outer membrane protein TolC